MDRQINVRRTRSAAKLPTLIDLISFLLPTGAFLLWCFSLKAVHIAKMNNLGFVSVMPPEMIIALMILMVSFCLALLQPRLRTPIILLHFALLIFMLYGVTTLVEQAPRFSIVYRHAGYTEYIMRTGTADPYLDAYFNWPGFFALTAFVTQIAGYQDILAYAAWSPVFYNVLYFVVLYLLFSTFTLNKRVIWLSLWIFHITNWIGQDYYSPQGLFFGLYLVILAILLKWFKTPPGTPIRPLGPRLSRIRFLPAFYDWLTAPDALYNPSSRRKQIALLATIITIFAFTTFSHQLTPFFILMSASLLIYFQRCIRQLWWLPIVMAVMITAWIALMTQPYLQGHMDQVFGGFGRIIESFNANVTNRVVGDPEHTFIARIRIGMTALLWVLAAAGTLFRLLKGYKDASVIILAIAPFPLFAAQPYGGEMLLRCYLFSQPAVVFLVASLFYDIPSFASFKKLKPSWAAGVHGTFRKGINRRAAWNAAPTHLRNTPTNRRPWIRNTALVCTLLILMGGFLYTRYGNEYMDYMTYDEVNGVLYLYNTAPSNSLFVAAWSGTPWQVKYFERFQLIDLSEEKNTTDIVTHSDVKALIRLMLDQQREQSYLIFTRSQKATFVGTTGLPASTMDRFEQAVQASGYFNLIYRNPDAQIFQLVSDVQGGE